MNKEINLNIETQLPSNVFSTTLDKFVSFDCQSMLRSSAIVRWAYGLSGKYFVKGRE